jgi:uncharacterized protein YcfJ
MKSILSATTFIAILSQVLISCQSPGQGALLGAGLGAAIGGIVGNQNGRGLEGAAIGAGIGAAGGALAGQQNQQNQSRYQNQPQQIKWCYDRNGRPYYIDQYGKTVYGDTRSTASPRYQNQPQWQYDRYGRAYYVDQYGRTVYGNSSSRVDAYGRPY